MNSNDPFKYLTIEDIRSFNSPIVFVISAEMVQEFCEANYDRRLTEKEVAQLWYGFCEDEGGYRNYLMDKAAEYAIAVANEEEEESQSNAVK